MFNNNALFSIITKAIDNAFNQATANLTVSPRDFLFVVTGDERWEKDASLVPPYETSLLARLQVPYDDPAIPAVLAAFLAAGATKITPPTKRADMQVQWGMGHPENNAGAHLIVQATPFPRYRGLLRFSKSAKECGAGEGDFAIIKVACDKDMLLLRRNAPDMRDAFNSAHDAAKKMGMDSSMIPVPVLQMLTDAGSPFVHNLE